MNDFINPELGVEIIQTGGIDQRIPLEDIRLQIDIVGDQRRKIVDSLSIAPTEEMQFGEDLGTEYLIRMYTEAGINITEQDIPKVNYIPSSRKQALVDALKPLGGLARDIEDLDGLSNTLGNLVIVFIKDGQSDYSTASFAFHERMHSLGRKAFISNGRNTNLRRVGLSHTESAYVLEEGVVEYCSQQFRDEILLHHPRYQKEAYEYAEVLIFLKQNRHVDRDNIMQFNTGVRVPFRYCKYITEDGRLTDIDVTSSNASAFLFDRILETSDRPGQLLKLALRSRVSSTENKKFYSTLQQIYGSPLLSRIISCPPSENQIIELAHRIG
jgi:hypothetical protein